MITLITFTTLASLIPLAVGTTAEDLFGAIALATAGGTVAGTIGAMFLLPPMLVCRRRSLRGVADRERQFTDSSRAAASAAGPGSGTPISGGCWRTEPPPLTH